MKTNQIEVLVTSYSDYGYSLFNVTIINQQNLIGVFIKDNDFDSLKKYNSWRMVLVENLPACQENQSQTLTEIVAGHTVKSIKLLKVIDSGSKQF